MVAFGWIEDSTLALEHQYIVPRKLAFWKKSNTVVPWTEKKTLVPAFVGDSHAEDSTYHRFIRGQLENCQVKSP
jgi:hypothetical protein